MRVVTLLTLLSFPAVAARVVDDTTPAVFNKSVTLRAHVEGGKAVYMYLNWKKVGEPGWRQPAPEMTEDSSNGPMGIRGFSVTLTFEQLGNSAVEYQFQAYLAGGGAPLEFASKTLAAPQPVTIAVNTTPIVKQSSEEDLRELIKPQPFVHRDHAASLSVLAAGAIAAGFGIGFGLQAKSAVDDLASANQASYVTTSNRAQSAATRANVAWVAAGVLAAAGGILLAFKF